MKGFSLFLVFIISVSSFAQLQLEGVFNNQKLYVQNPFADETHFCTDSIHINGKLSNTNVMTSAYEINLDSLGLVSGDSLVIIIFHKPDCRPKVLSPGPIFTGVNIQFQDLVMTKDAMINCKIQGEKRAFISVQQYRWNKWVTISQDSLMALPLDYSFDVNAYLHSGENKFRLTGKYGSPSRPNRNSKSVQFIGPERGGEYEYSSSKQIVVFTNYTMYELYDDHGNIVKKGTGIHISFKDLKYGTYFLNFDNKNVKIKHKKWRK